MKETSERVRGVRFTQRPKAFSCFSSILRQVGGEDWVAVGDAAASHDPLSSTGIPHAIGMGVHGALAAANSLFSNGESLKGYQETIHDDFLQYLRTHWRYYRREDRWPDSVFWRRRTTPVSIDPNEKFQRVERSTNTIDPNEKFQRVERSTNTFSGPNDLVHLPARFSRQLYESCKPGRFAHQIVREFAGSHPQVPDQQIIFGLQELVANGHVKIDVPKVSDEIAPRGVQGEALLNQSD